MHTPPLLVSFDSLTTYLDALLTEVREEFESDIRSLSDQGLPPITSVRCLATLFGFSSKLVGSIKSRPERYYRTYYIPKGKARRRIDSPRVALKVIQKWFGYHLEQALTFPEPVCGFVSGRSAIWGAAAHCGADWVYSVDIVDFFRNVKLDTIVYRLTKIGYPTHGSALAGALTTYEGALPQGSPASPVLSNLVFQEADSMLVQLAEKHRSRYTRYADDIVFSGHGTFPEALSRNVKDVVEKHGWRLSSKKEDLATRPKRLKVYGLLVDGDKPRLTKGYRNKIRAFKHLIGAGRVADEDRPRLLGHLAYAASVERFQGRDAVK